MVIVCVGAARRVMQGCQSNHRAAAGPAQKPLICRAFPVTS